MEKKVQSSSDLKHITKKAKMKIEEIPIHSMILQNDADGVKGLLNDASIDFQMKNERGNQPVRYR